MEEVRPGKYRHIKGGLYEVIGVAEYSELNSGFFELVGVAKYTEEPDRQFIVYRLPDSPAGGRMFYKSFASLERSVLESLKDPGLGDLVVYWSLTEEGERKEFWARSKKMFTENVRKEGGIEIPRFRYVGEI